MVADDRATTGVQTHRYLRLSLVFVVFALLTSVAMQTVIVSWEPLTVGWSVQPTLSDYFYTPARNVFVGALIAASLALFALAGRDRAALLLDVSAVFAPLIALVPTGVSAQRTTDGLTCPSAADCLPADDIDDVRAGVATYAVVVIVVVIVLGVIRARKGIVTRGAVVVSGIAVLTAAAVSTLVLVPALGDGSSIALWPSPTSIHFAVTLIFFGTFAAVPILRSRDPVDDRETPPTPRQKRIYRWISLLLITDLVLLVVAFVIRDALPDVPLVLIGEALALILFAWFWWVQTFQRWDDADPPSIRVSAASSRGTGSARG